MHLLRIGSPGREVPAAQTDEGELRDLRPLTADIDGAFLAADGIARAREALDTLPPLHGDSAMRIGSPVARGHAIVCIGLNYADHAAETGAAVPAEPVVFAKATSTLAGPNDPIVIPPGSTTTDYEVELAVVLGATARYLVPADDVPDPQTLALELRVNGDVRQTSSTDQMIFGVAHLVWYLSQHLYLEPGDVINTGTPGGVALARPDLPYLRAGDVVELSIEGLGQQRQAVVAS